MQYNENNLIKIEGMGKSGIDIFYEYLYYIRNGYDVTINEACIYLGCSYTYFVTKLVEKISHIRINEVARNLIFNYGNQECELDETVLDLIMKRILLSRNDFRQFLIDNVIIEQILSPEKDITVESRNLAEGNNNEDIPNSSEAYEKRLNCKGLLIKNKEKEITKCNTVRRQMDGADEIPEKLYSMKELKISLGIANDIQVYRIIKRLCIKKYIIGDLVRYNIKDFNL